MNDNWHRSIVGILASIIRPKSYLELGLGTDPTLTGISTSCGWCYGVDKGGASFPVPANCTVFAMDTDTFFDGPVNSIQPPQLVFVDADHRSRQVLKDLENLSAICDTNCIVVCHDTYPENQNYTADTFCSDSYRVPDLISWEHVTIPIHPGATILRMKPMGRI